MDDSLYYVILLTLMGGKYTIQKRLDIILGTPPQGFNQMFNKLSIDSG